MGQRGVGPDRNHLAEKARRDLELPALLRHHAQQMQAADMLWLARENGVAERLRFRPLAALVMPDRLFEQGRGRGRARGRRRRTLLLRGAALLAVHRGGLTTAAQ